MRLLCTVRDSKQAENLHDFLTHQGISNQIDKERNRDWGSDDYGTEAYHVWIIDEDQADKAYRLYESFLSNPPVNIPKPQKSAPQPKTKPVYKKASLAQSSPITFYLLVLCCLLFFIDGAMSPEFKASPNSSQMIEPVYTSPIKQEMLYDFPKAFVILSKLITLYGVEGLSSTSNSPQAAALVQEYKDTPSWQGLYALVVGEGQPGAPLFEKIREGEIWRLISPIFLHGDIFHLLFNMLWLYVLGTQLEIHLGIKRYLSFIFLTAAFTNTCQYLMSGPNFIGISGVLCAMITYVYVRQRVAPWEGYQLQRSTFLFITLFILGMFAIQVMSFLLTLWIGQGFATSIANTAHLSGALLGLLLGVTPYFTSQRRERS
jgi:GlpG protein